MKFQFVAKVVGHELVEGDKPKTDSDLMKVKLSMRPVRDTPGKSGSATFTLPAEEGALDFPLRRTLLITCEECQYELFAEMAGEEAKAPGRPGRKTNQTEFGLPVGDSPIATPPERGTVTPIGRARRRGGRRKSQAAPESMH